MGNNCTLSPQNEWFSWMNRKEPDSGDHFVKLRRNALSDGEFEVPPHLLHRLGIFLSGTSWFLSISPDPEPLQHEFAEEQSWPLPGGLPAFPIGNHAGGNSRGTAESRSEEKLVRVMPESTGHHAGPPGVRGAHGRRRFSAAGQLPDRSGCTARGDCPAPDAVRPVRCSGRRSRIPTGRR